MPDSESWIVETGSRIIRKKADLGEGALSPHEKALYCLWVIDYSVRNSGTLAAVEDLHPSAVRDLRAFAMRHDLQNLNQWLAGASDEEEFCESYDQWFDSCSSQLRQYVEHAY